MYNEVLVNNDHNLSYTLSNFRDHDCQHVAEGYLELASDQRLEILLLLQDQSSRIFQMANVMNSTKQEIHRNVSRLVNCGLISKDNEGYFHNTTYGKTMCTQISNVKFFTKNKQYFKEHSLGDIPNKFIMRIGQLHEGQYIKGVTRVLSTCQSIYDNAEKYVYEILAELSLDRNKVLATKTKSDVKLEYITSESAIVQNGRKQLLEKIGWRKLILKGFIERKMKKDVQILITLNEKEACVMFPRINVGADLSEAFWSDSNIFHEWCLDYFKHSWTNSGIWKENKLEE